LAFRQHGVVARRQLIEVGLLPGAVDRRLAAGRLLPLYRGVYALGHKALSMKGRWMAAVLACGTEAVLSHRDAAALWGVRGVSGTRIDVTAPKRSHAPQGIALHRANLAPHDKTSRDNIPTTASPARCSTSHPCNPSMPSFAPWRKPSGRG
jgi:hypothetical protein